jgi:hypothetical protein
MTKKLWGALALAGVLLVTAAVASAAPPAGKPPEHPQKPAQASAKNTTALQEDHGNASAQERGQGLLNALQHVPDHVRAHLQSLWDAMHAGLQGLGDAVTKPLRPNHA